MPGKGLRCPVGAPRVDHHSLVGRLPGPPLADDLGSLVAASERNPVGEPDVPDRSARWATMALTAGVPPKVVQERLGHANISITLDTYSHVTEGLHDDAAAKVAGLVFGDGG